MLNMLFRILLSGVVAFTLALPVNAQVIVPGTGDSQSLLRQLSREFTVETGIAVEIPDSIGSFGGIQSVVDGKAILARVARPIRSKEEQYDLNYRVFAYSPVVLVVNRPDNCVSDLTSDQLIGIYRGDLTNWMKFQGCSAAKINAVGREPGDSSRTVLETYFPSLTEVMRSTGKTVYTTPELIEVLENFQYTIGYAPLAMVDRQKLTVLSLNGIAPTPANVRNGSYPLTTPFGIIWKGKLKGEEKRFYDYLFSAKTQKRIAELGLIPVLDQSNFPSNSQ